MKQIEEQLKNLKSARQEINPSPEWILKSREKLFSQIRNSIGQTPEPVSFVFSFQSFLKFFVPPQAYHVMKVASVFVFAIGITVGGWIGGVSASHNCLPGDFCYNVKLAAEKTQVAMASVTGDKNKEVTLHMEFASRRLDEVNKVTSEYKVEALQALKKSLESVGTTLQAVNEKDPGQAAEFAKDISKKTSDIVRSLNSTGGELATSPDTAKEIVDTTKVVNDTGIQALVIAIAGENGKTTTSDDIKAIVEDKMNLILDGGKDAQIAAHEVQDIMQNAVASSTASVAENPSTESSENSNPVLRIDDPAPVSTSTVAAVGEAATKADQTVVDAQKMVSEVKALLSENNVDQALEKVKALNDVVTETKQQLVDAQKVILTEVAPAPVVEEKKEEEAKKEGEGENKTQ
jgi:hypothetical protein